jgi:dephospho-CoA kinase
MQLARLLGREGTSREDARARIRAQKPLAEKVALADFVVDTSGTLAEGAERADAALAAVCARVGVDSARYAPRELR